MLPFTLISVTRSKILIALAELHNRFKNNPVHQVNNDNDDDDVDDKMCFFKPQNVHYFIIIIIP